MIRQSRSISIRITGASTGNEEGLLIAERLSINNMDGVKGRAFHIIGYIQLK